MKASTVAANQQSKKIKESTINESDVGIIDNNNKAFEAQDQQQQLDQQGEQQFDKLNVVQSSRKRKTSNVQKKKRKKKKQQDDVITEITTGSSSNSSLGLIIGGLLFAAHILAIIIYIISMVVYITQAKHFAQQVNNLKSVCDLATYCCQMSPLGLMLLVHDYEFNFQYPGSADGKAATIRRLSGVKSKLKETSADIIKVISQLYDMTSLTGPWEENSMEAYIFETGDGICTRIDGVEGQCEGFITRHQEATNNLISGFIEMAQKAHYMGNAEGDLHQFSTFHSDLAYIIFNPISPILESCKRAMVKYWEFTTSLTSQILMIFLSVILSIMILEFTLLAIIYIMFSLKIIKERKNALQQALEVSKQKMQKVIRRLLQEDDDEDGNEDQTQDGSFVQRDQSTNDFSEPGKLQQLKEQEQEQDLNDLDIIQKEKDKQIEQQSKDQQQDESSDVSEEDEAEDEKILLQNNDNENNQQEDNNDEENEDDGFYRTKTQDE
ncbi:MAG: hypothetical protein EZS28_032371, partial [Streblomastix strix]